MGYASTFETYLILTVKQGAVIRIWKGNDKEFSRFCEAQFAAFKKTGEYRAAMEDLKKDSSEPSMSPEMMNEFIREYFSGKYLAMVFD